VRLGQFPCLTNLGGKRAELVQKFVPRSRIEIFLMNAPDQPHWTLNFCFGVFRTIWVQLGQFDCLTNLGGKRAELVQMFVPRSRVGIFRNERTRSTPFVSKLMFWRVWYHLGAFGTAWRHYESRYEAGRTRAKVLASKSRRNGSQRMHPIHPIGP